MRQLIRVPIVHTSVDLGSLSESVRARYLKESGPTMWSRRERTVAELWDAIREKIDVLDVDYKKVRIYQDGLPVCKFEQEIVEQLAQAGSRNHQLVLDLVGKGATLIGTEDPQLLIREYELQQRHLGAPADSAHAPGEPAEQAKCLLEARDRFIAKRIDETLLPDETGLLFLGAAHRLDMRGFLNIQVQTLR